MIESLNKELYDIMDVQTLVGSLKYEAVRLAVAKNRFLFEIARQIEDMHRSVARRFGRGS